MQRWGLALLAVLAGLLAVPSTAASVGLIDPYRYDFTGSACSLGPRPGASALLQWLTEHDAVGASGGIYACRPILGSGELSLHAEGRAVDWELDNREPRQRRIADGLIDAWLKRRHGHDHALARRMGIQEIIWNCRIWTSGRPDDGLVAYAPCSASTDRTARHENHVHVGLNHDGAGRRSSFWAGGSWPQDLLAVGHADTGRAQLRVLDGGTSYTSFLSRGPTRLTATSSHALSFLSGDYDGDRVDDLFVIGYKRASRRVHVFVYSGAGGFRSRLLAARTVLRAPSARRFAFGLGDRDHDGSLDLYAIRYGAARSTRVQVLDGAERYRSVLSATRTPLPRTSASTFQFAIGDRDNDGSDDIYAIRHPRAGATTAYVLDGATSFRSVQAIRTALPKASTRRARFAVGDANDDGQDDIHAIRSRAKTAEIVSLAGPRFDSFNLRARVTLPLAGRGGWTFALPAQPGL